MPRSLFSLSFIFFLFSPVISAGLDAKDGCPDRCGNLSIPYPFGVRPSCSLNRYFIINCDDSAGPPKAYLSFINKRVFEINESYIRVEPLNMFSVCYEHDGSRIETYNDSVTMNLSGTPYALPSYINVLTAIGCDDAVLQTNGSSTINGCSAFCPDKKETGGFGYCQFNATSLGNGCCQAPIPQDTTTVGAQLIDLSRKARGRKLFPCSYAFIQEKGIRNATELSYPLYYLDNSTALLKDNWASATRQPMARLEWVVGAENCSLAKLDNDTYACRDEKSVCVDDDGDGYQSRQGYRCSCVQGYEGNPYLPGGCKTIEVQSSSIARHGCVEQCGKLPIRFPFGVGRKCALEPSFEIVCNSSTNPARAYLPVLQNAEIVGFSSSKVLVKRPISLGFACYNSSVYGGIINKTEDRSLVIDLSGTQFTLSDGNWVTAIGVDDTVVGDMRHVDGSSTRSICAAVLESSYLNDDTFYGNCPWGSSEYYPGSGCCRASVPRGTSYLEANLTGFSGRSRPEASCSFSFLQNYQDGVISSSYRIPNNSTEITSWDTTISMDWRVGAVNCNQTRQNLACQINSKCVDFDATVGGYLCNCSEGYHGNPYLTPGCQDINECANSTTNACNSVSSCINTPGSYYCSCPKGYIGDGKKDGSSCIQLPPSKAKTTILIGLGAGLGMILLVLLCLLLHKVFEKRKKRKHKEDLFKHILLQQQTSEGTFGKTKLYTAKELAKATDGFSESRVCGQGGQGVVYKGMLSDGTIVAIKKLRHVDEDQVEQFINEVVILSQINHKNVVRLLGCCLATVEPLLVYEFLPNGTLYDFIHVPKVEFPLTWDMRLKIAAEVAGALAYLHSASSIPIYHRDIKSKNILLDEKYIVKVSDFGISKLVEVDQTHLTTLVKGTFGYLDPEYYQTSQYTDKSDVYSFGVVLVELLTGKRPISMDRLEMARNLASHFLSCMQENNLDDILDAQVSEQGKREEVMAVAKLARRCLNGKGRMRPVMRELATELESLRISQLPSIVNEEAEEAMVIQGKHMMFSDVEYTWTISDDSMSTSASAAHPLMFEAV